MNTLTPSPVYLRDYGIRITAEYRNGPIVTCEATFIREPDGWIVDEIFTRPESRRRGHAKAILQRIVEFSGMPVVPHLILEEAKPFWREMAKEGICARPGARKEEG